MRKPTIVSACLGVFFAAVVLGIYLEPTQTVLGYLRGDNFYQGRSASYWQKVLRSNDTSSLESAELVPFLVAALDDRKPAVRIRAASILGTIGEPARDAVPALLKAGSGPDGKIHKAALAGFQIVDESAKEHPDCNVKLEFGSEDEAAYYAAAAAARKIDPTAAKHAGCPKPP